MPAAAIAKADDTPALVVNLIPPALVRKTMSPTKEPVSSWPVVPTVPIYPVIEPPVLNCIAVWPSAGVSIFAAIAVTAPVKIVKGKLVETPFKANVSPLVGAAIVTFPAELIDALRIAPV